MALVVTNPTVGLVWTRGNQYEIRWTGANTDWAKLNIIAYKAAASTAITQVNVSANGTYSWTLPSTLVAGTDYRIRISELD